MVQYRSNTYGKTRLNYYYVTARLDLLLWLGIGNLDWGLGFGNDDWGLGLGIEIGDWDLGLGIGIGDWNLGFVIWD